MLLSDLQVDVHPLLQGLRDVLATGLPDLGQHIDAAAAQHKAFGAKLEALAARLK